MARLKRHQAASRLNGKAPKKQKLELEEEPDRPDSESLVLSNHEITEQTESTEAENYLPIALAAEGTGVENGATVAIVINPDAPDVAPSNLQRSAESDDEFSPLDGPDEPETADPLGNSIEMALPELHDENDALVDENQAVQASVAAVAVPFQNAPIAHDVASAALEKLEFILQPSKAAGTGYKPPMLNSMFSIRRLGAMAACLRYYCNAKLRWSLTYSSEVAAIGAGYGIRFGRNIRRFIRAFINTDNIPENQYGTWNASVLEDEDLATELKDYLVECKGRYMRAQDIVDYLNRPDVKQRFKLDEPPSLRTAQRWMQEFGFRWGLDPKGQYVDGHEREDVVKYRNEHYIQVWTDLERRMYWFDSITMEKHMPTLQPGERMVMVWFHDESIFYANDRRLTRWVHFTEGAKPYAKGEGVSMMVADFVGIDGWLYGSNPGDNARVVLSPGKTRDGYFTGERVRQQLIRAIEVAKTKYPDADHVFVYDNATTHTRRREDVAAISKMTLGPSSNVGDVVETRTNEDGVVEKIRVRYADVQFPDGSPQCLYYPDDHPVYGAEATGGTHGQFKGIAEILREREISVAGLKLTCSGSKKCVPYTRCCARQLLAEQPGFAEQQSALEEIAEANGCQILFLPKFHCELNPIEQCWGYAKRVYRQFPPSKSQTSLRSNMLAALDSIPVESIRRQVIYIRLP